MGLYWGAFNAVAFRTHASFGPSSQFFETIFFSEPLLGVFTYTHGVYCLCCQVLVMTHEKANEAQMDSYFANKFHPARPVYVLGRSYKAEPKCKPQETLFDNWMDRSHSHAMIPHCQPCIMPSCVPHSIVHHFCSLEFGKSCQSLPPDKRHACSYGNSFWMRHTVECLTAHGFCSHYSSLPPCSEVVCGQVTLVDPSTYDPISQTVCASMAVASVVPVSYLHCSCF